MKIARDPAEAGSMVDFLPFFKAFCNPIRAQIIEFLLGGERCVCEMTGPLDQIGRASCRERVYLRV